MKLLFLKLQKMQYLPCLWFLKKLPYREGSLFNVSCDVCWYEEHRTPDVLTLFPYFAMRELP